MNVTTPVFTPGFVIIYELTRSSETHDGSESSEINGNNRTELR
jgi:hypothetical protein